MKGIRAVLNSHLK